MGLGSLLVGVALVLVAGAFLARPFQTAKKTGNLEQTIEGWVERVRTQSTSAVAPAPPDLDGDRLNLEATDVSYCPQCGSRVGPDARFCSHCGARLPKDAA
jgi:hypothetical protein